MRTDITKEQVFQVLSSKDGGGEESNWFMDRSGFFRYDENGRYAKIMVGFDDCFIDSPMIKKLLKLFDTPHLSIQHDSEFLTIIIGQ